MKKNYQYYSDIIIVIKLVHPSNIKNNILLNGRFPLP